MVQGLAATGHWKSERQSNLLDGGRNVCFAPVLELAGASRHRADTANADFFNAIE
jgi:hypothetical protein